jgi:tetratricopeptide (TPR) repeat protein
VLGPAGVGKSRLAQEVLGSLEGDATVVAGRCLPYGEGITYWPLLEVLESLGRSPDEVLASSSEETFWRVRKLLEGVAAERPLVVLLDDMHWAEPTFLDLVEHLADLSRDAPILLLCLARPELLDARSAWGGGKLNATSILLEALGEEEVARLIDNLAGELGEAARVKIAAAAEGNPLFVEEMLAMLTENGDEPEVPPTIQALLAARLDRLDPAERDVLGRASVEGKVFHAGGVATLAPDDLRPAVRGYLTGLVRKELIRPDRPVFEGEDAFRFRHLLIRDAAYQSLPKEARAELHDQFAKWLEHVVAERVEEYEEILGYHLEQAHRYRTELRPADERAEALGRAAAARLGAAGQRASGRGDLPAAASLLGRAAALLPDDDIERLRLLPDLGNALAGWGRLAESEAVLTESVERAARAGAREIEARARIERLEVWLLSDPEGRVEEATTEVERLLPLLEELGDDRTLAKAWHVSGVTHLMRCEFDELERLSERQYMHARRAANGALMDDALFWIGAAVIFGRTPVGEGISRLLALPPPQSATQRADLDCALASLYGMAGRYAEARELHARGRARLRELGLEVMWAGVAMMAGWIELWAGDPAAAEGVLREGCETLTRMGERSYLSTTAVVLAQALYDQGSYDEAEAWTRTAEEAGASDDLTTQVGWRATRAKVFARRGDLAGAELLAREAVELADRGETLVDSGTARLDLAEVLRLAGREAEAAPVAEEALRLYEQKGIVGLVERARVFLAQPAQPPATA